ncbi:MAG: hypothetical protein A2089_00620 [Elusimicrobia bacterium GWD2_63_28]|nr:MAG: hypothetical protein A2089_00620 [Elusimicrobia bacterium GWD2_63_28]
MTGKQIFWSCALAGYIVFLGIAMNSGDGFGGFCLALISGGVAAIVGFFYAIFKFVKWFGKAPEPAERGERAPARSVRKEMGRLKKKCDANTAALLQYINDALRDGGEEGAVRSALLDKGWPEELVTGAFSAYKEMLAKYPLPGKGLSA